MNKVINAQEVMAYVTDEILHEEGRTITDTTITGRLKTIDRPAFVRVIEQDGTISVKVGIRKDEGSASFSFELFEKGEATKSWIGRFLASGLSLPMFSA